MNNAEGFECKSKYGVDVEKIEKGLYIHVPFCISKCKYCDFHSWGSFSEDGIRAYLKNLEVQFRVFADQFGLDELKWDTLFIGGGTPTSLNVSKLKELLDLLNKYINFKNRPEITIEANPNSLTKNKIDLLLGTVNRVSIGLQSTDSKYLKLLGRTHTYEDFLKTHQLLKDRGLMNINVDLIYGLPGQKCHEFEQDLDAVLFLEPSHISLYNLTLEENTPLYDEYQKGKLPEIDEDQEVEMYYRARKKLLEAGYIHYELSNFAKPGFQCQHNIIYWSRKDYLGLGPSAHSLWNNYRFVIKHELISLEKYQGLDQGKFEELFEALVERSVFINREEALSERLFLGLRLTEGIDLKKLLQEFNIDVEQKYGQAMDKLIDEGLLKKSNDIVKLTEKGYMLSNYVFMEFLPTGDSTSS